MQIKENCERRLRTLAKRSGYVLRKSRVRTPHLDDFGSFMLIEVRSNFIVLGSRYGATLEDISEFLAR